MLADAGADIIISYPHQSQGGRSILWQLLKRHLCWHVISCYELHRHRQILLDDFIDTHLNLLYLFDRRTDSQLIVELALLALHMRITRARTPKHPDHRLVEDMLGRMHWSNKLTLKFGSFIFFHYLCSDISFITGGKYKDFPQNDQIEMNKTAIYCRVSTQMQTTDRQKEELLKYAEEHNMTIEPEMIFVDVISGFKKGEVRPEYSKMIELVNTGEINVILFSEMTRHSRSCTELLSEIEKLINKGVEVYYQKQNLWVKNIKHDIGTKILLNVLAAMASYEVELFAERTLSGKATKVSKGGGDTDSRTLGYYNNEEKKITINIEEASLVKRIFEMYANGKSTLQICEILNNEKIPTKSKALVEIYQNNRKKKGLEPKDYSDLENRVWRASTISRMLSNELYLGKRNLTYHKPDPTNPTPIEERTNREVAFEFKEQDENLRIISDDLWYEVQQKLSQAKYNKNNATKHETLLTGKMICGECGSNYSVSRGEQGRVYKCYGTVSRQDKKKICNEGAGLLMKRIDGLVISVSMGIFIAKNNIEHNKAKQIELQKEVEELSKHQSIKIENLKREDEDFSKKLKRLLILDNDKEVEILMVNLQKDHKQKREKLEQEIKNGTEKISQLRADIKKLDAINLSISNFDTIEKQVSTLKENKSLLTNMVKQYITQIVVFRCSTLWSLYIIKYYNGKEIWGTVKCARYKKDEILPPNDGNEHEQRYISCIIDNSRHEFAYIKESKSVIFHGSKVGRFPYLESGKTYLFEDLYNLIKENGGLGSFPDYLYEE